MFHVARFSVANSIILCRPEDFFYFLSDALQFSIMPPVHDALLAARYSFKILSISSLMKNIIIKILPLPALSSIPLISDFFVFAVLTNSRKSFSGTLLISSKAITNCRITERKRFLDWAFMLSTLSSGVSNMSNYRLLSTGLPRI
jgi:hypothetical protein